MTRAGWYQDPQRPPGHLRYWDGHQWTEHRAARPQPAARRQPTNWATWVAVTAAICMTFGIGAFAIGLSSAPRDAVEEPLLTGDSDRDTVEDPDERAGNKREPKPKRNTTSPRNTRPAANREPETSKTPRSPRPKPVPTPEPPTQQLFYVARIVDGDTMELGNGETVRLVGIDTPEVGECGFEAASDALAALVLGQYVRLTVSDENQDQYGRLLRYANIGTMDAGLRLIKRGLAVARYDSRDGYGYHPREDLYIDIDAAAENVSCPKPAPLVGPTGGNCAAGYTPCIPPYPPDLDCADVDGPIYVSGSDPHGLDADGDDAACES